MDRNYGILINEQDIKLQRIYFNEMCSLIGVFAKYRAPKKDKHWTQYSEIDSNYQPQETVGCIFNENVDQRTLKKLGWVTELDTQVTIISVPYDLKDLQVGALFILPGAIDNSQGRLFRVTKLSTIAIYPASITCEVVPEYINNMDISLKDH